METGPTLPAAREVRRGLRARLFAWSLAHAGDTHRRHYDGHKRVYFAGLAGTVVEIGAGAGPNAAHLAPGTRWIVIEPNVHFHLHLRQQAERHGLDLDIRTGVAERLPVEDGAADAVVSTLVLCSVGDVGRALREVRRVLRPGGRFVFIEHVAAAEGTLLRRLQQRLRRPWGWIADGCRPDRETGEQILQAGFSDVQMKTFRVSLGLAAPHVAGVATV